MEKHLEKDSEQLSGLTLNTKCPSDINNKSKGDVLTITSITKIDIVTNKNSKSKPCNGIKTEHRKLMTEDKNKCGDDDRECDK